MDNLSQWSVEMYISNMSDKKNDVWPFCQFDGFTWQWDDNPLEDHLNFCHFYDIDNKKNR